MSSKDRIEIKASPRAARVFSDQEELPPGAMAALNRRSAEELQALADRANRVS